MNTLSKIPQGEHPWYQQFWFWFLIALPGTVVIASIATLIIALRHSDNLVDDDYYKDGLAINRYLAQDALASTLKLSASIAMRSADTVVITLSGAHHSPDHLFLQWQHPTHEALDFTSVLTLQGENRYTVQLQNVPDGRWYITLENTPEKPDALISTNTDSWRLKYEVYMDRSVSGPTINILSTSH